MIYASCTKSARNSYIFDHYARKENLNKNEQLSIGRFQSIKTDVLLIFLFITGDKTEFLSPIMFSNEYITGI